MKSKTKTLFILCLINLSINLLNAQNDILNHSLNSYSIDLYREAKIDNENLLISPLSTYYTLLMAHEGSENQTKQELEKVLYLKPQQAVKDGILYNLKELIRTSADLLNISNAIWVDDDVKINDEYRNTVENNYSSLFEKTNFSNVNAAVSKINQWVTQSTNNRINNFVSAQNIDKETKMMISNVVYFKGEWQNKFEKKNTRTAPFFSNTEDQFQIDFMKMTENLPYFENDELQFIAKPYKDSTFSFCIVLPKNLFGIEDIEKKLNPNFLKEITDGSYSTNTSLSLPKIKLESSLMLKETLERLGLNTAFTEEADFSGITQDKPTFIQQILHRAWIELDEEKTEAAAATATTVYIRGGGARSSSKIFKADHPFIFFLKDNKTNTILFMGRYIKPALGVKIEKENLKKNIEDREREGFSTGNPGDRILYIVNDKIIKNLDLRDLNPNDIESFNVIKGKREISKYSEGNYDGAIIIKLKKDKGK